MSIQPVAVWVSALKIWVRETWRPSVEWAYQSYHFSVLAQTRKNQIPPILVFTTASRLCVCDSPSSSRICFHGRTAFGMKSMMWWTCRKWTIPCLITGSPHHITREFGHQPGMGRGWRGIWRAFDGAALAKRVGSGWRAGPHCWDWKMHTFLEGVGDSTSFAQLALLY